MRPFFVRRSCGIKGKITLLGDKSIAHRSVIISAISRGKTVIRNFPANDDCLATLKALKDLGVDLVYRKQLAEVMVCGRGLYGLSSPLKKYLFCAQSGTTFRLLLGLLAGQDFATTLKAGGSLSRRPMRRVTEPLRMMGAIINSTPPSAGPPSAEKIEEYPPITIRGGDLKPITYRMPVASAQVKSAILLAGLYAGGQTKVIEPIATRDHTERMLGLFKADIKVRGNIINIRGGKNLVSCRRVYIPGDLSSAAFFMAAAAILPHSRLTIKQVGLNPSRLGIVKVLKRMGADIKFRVQGSGFRVQYEPMGDIIVKSSALNGARVRKEEIPSLIDELPVLMVAACFAKGETVLEGVEELRVKETDRIRSMKENLQKMGAKIVIRRRRGKEDLIIEGVNKLHGAKVSSFNDHRTAMSMVVAGLAAEGATRIDDISCLAKSFPEFLTTLKPLIQ